MLVPLSNLPRHLTPQMPLAAASGELNASVNVNVYTSVAAGGLQLSANALYSEGGSVHGGYYMYPAKPRTPDASLTQRVGAGAGASQDVPQVESAELEEPEAVFLPPEHLRGNQSGAASGGDASSSPRPVVKRRLHQEAADAARVSPESTAVASASAGASDAGETRHSGQSDDSTPTASASNSARNTMQAAGAASDRSSGATISLLVADDTLNMCASLLAALCSLLLPVSCTALVGQNVLSWRSVLLNIEQFRTHELDTLLQYNRGTGLMG